MGAKIERGEKILFKNSVLLKTIWLRFLDTYRTMCVAPRPEFRQVLQNIRTLDLAA